MSSPCMSETLSTQMCEALGLLRGVFSFSAVFLSFVMLEINQWDNNTMGIDVRNITHQCMLLLENNRSIMGVDYTD